MRLSGPHSRPLLLRKSGSVGNRTPTSELVAKNYDHRGGLCDTDIVLKYNARLNGWSFISTQPWAIFSAVLPYSLEEHSVYDSQSLHCSRIYAAILMAVRFIFIPKPEHSVDIFSSCHPHLFSGEAGGQMCMYAS
jgi:hypothetical protein